MFYGPGAGELPTATAITSDLVTVVKNMKLGVNGRGMVAPYRETVLKTPEQIESKFFLRLIVSDQRGVLAEITSLLANSDISIEQIMQQPCGEATKQAEIIIITHMATKANMEKLLRDFSHLKSINEVKSLYRVEGGEEK